MAATQRRNRRGCQTAGRKVIMSAIHVYCANDQPATRYFVDMSTLENGVIKPNGFWSRARARHQLYARCCKRRRYAKNLVAHVYYDGTWFYCRKGKGCKVLPKGHRHGS